MTLSDKKPTSCSNLDSYMLYLLQASHQYNRKLEESAISGISFFLIFIPAVTTLVIAAFIKEQEFHLGTISLFIGAGFLGVVGFFVFFWELKLLSTRIRGGIFTYIFHRYFQEKDPKAFNKFGLSIALNVFHEEKSTKNHLSLAGKISVFSIAIFSSFFIGFSYWSYDLMADVLNNLPRIMLFSIKIESCVIGVIWFIICCGIFKSSIEGTKDYQRKIEKIFLK